MDGESLAELKVAFEEWRRRKRHSREAVLAITCSGHAQQLGTTDRLQWLGRRRGSGLARDR